MNSVPGAAAEAVQRSLSLSFAEALVPPCQDCDALCCCYLPLQVLPVRNLMEADYLRYLLGFPHIRAGFSVGGQWSVYYTVPCRLLDPDQGLCTVHGTSEQPRTCVAYNEHDCWYQRSLNAESPGYLLFDRGRMEQLLALMTFDRDRNIASVPSWDEMVALCSHSPLRPSQAEIRRGIGFTAAPPLPASKDGEHPEKTASELRQDPCGQCPAPCCRYLIFPLPVPGTFMQLDYVEFCLNFPGVELAVSPASWSLLLRADCEALQQEPARCRLYGAAARPLRCAHLNQWDCGQYKQLLDGDPATLRRIDREAFRALMQEMRFDDSGRIVQGPALFD